MAFIYPIEEFYAPIPGKDPCGELAPDIDASLSALESAIKLESSTRTDVEKFGFQNLGSAAEIFFRGGKLPDLTSQKSQRTFDIKPIRHLLPAMVLTTAWLENDGIPGFADGLALIENLLASQWDNVYPKADPEVEDAPFYKRVNALSPLSLVDAVKNAASPGAQMTKDSWGIESRLLKAALFESDNHGKVSVAESISPWAPLLAVAVPPADAKTKEFIDEVRLGSTGTLQHQRECLQSAVNSAKKISESFLKAPDEIKPKLNYLIRIMEAGLSVMDDKVAGNSSAAAAAATGGAQAAPKTAAQSSGPVNSREDAVRKLTEVADYFRRTEPSSPVPHILERAKRLAGMNFISILEELHLGDEAKPAFEKLAGIREKPEAK